MGGAETKLNSDNWVFNAAGEQAGLPYLDVQNVRIFDARSLVPLAQYADGTFEKIGYTVHHDVVPFDKLTFKDELERIQAIDTYHRNHNGWPGIGYHRVIAPSGRVYLVGGSATQRAHIAELNHLWIGYCLLGDWTNARPPEAQMNALIVATQWETNMRGVDMLVAPHKRLTNTECPGSWAAKDAWATTVLKPTNQIPLMLPQASVKQQLVTKLQEAEALARQLI